MAKVWTIARFEYLINIRRPGFIIITLLIPALGALALLAGILFREDALGFLERQFSSIPDQFGIVDQAGYFTPLLDEYRSQFHAYPDEATGRAAIAGGDIGVLLIIPPDYMALGRVLVITQDGGIQAAELEDSSVVRAFFVDHLLRDTAAPELRARLTDPVTVVPLSLNETGASNAGPLGFVFGFFASYFLGVLLIITIFTASGYLLRSVSEEKTTRVIEIILSSVSARELLAGKVLGLGTVGLTQVIIWLASIFTLASLAADMLGASIPITGRPEIILFGLIYYLLGYLVYAVLMGTAGALGTSQQESQQLAGIFSLLAAVPMMFAGFVIPNPNVPIARIFSWIPLTAPTMMLIRIPLARVPVLDIVASIVLSALFIPLVLWAGAKVFRLGLLMYGSRPSIRQIARALREA